MSLHGRKLHQSNNGKQIVWDTNTSKWLQSAPALSWKVRGLIGFDKYQKIMPNVGSSWLLWLTAVKYGDGSGCLSGETWFIDLITGGWMVPTDWSWVSGHSFSEMPMESRHLYKWPGQSFYLLYPMMSSLPTELLPNSWAPMANHLGLLCIERAFISLVVFIACLPPYLCYLSLNSLYLPIDFFCVVVLRLLQWVRI